MKVVFAIICLIVAACAHETYIPNSKHPDFANKCLLKETNDAIDVGSILRPVGVCRRFTCRDDFVIRVDHCPRYMIPDDCDAIPVDLTKPFPDCCVKLRCIDNEGNEQIRATAFDW